MSHVAKLFTNGRSQAVRLPKKFRFEGKEVNIRHDPVTGDVILSRRPKNWDGFFELAKAIEIPDSFLSAEERDQGPHDRDPFAGWTE